MEPLFEGRISGSGSVSESQSKNFDTDTDADTDSEKTPASVARYFRLFAFIRRMAGTSLDAFFPKVCCGCGKLFKSADKVLLIGNSQPLPMLFKQLMGACLCGPCGEQFHAIGSPLCTQCGQPFVSPHGPDHLCGHCLAHPFRFASARAAGLHQGALRAAIHYFKYQGRDTMSKPLGRLLWQTLVRNWDPAHFDCVVPVPLHSRRLRQRGFNQAHALIRGWPKLAAQQGLSVRPDWIAPGILRRQRATQPQTGLKRNERAANLRNAFGVIDRQRIHAARILLVDDVMTTGATVEACAKTLLKAGAAEVHVLTLARAVA